MLLRGARAAFLVVILACCFPVLGLDSEEQAFLGIINSYRASYGLGSLSLSPTLTIASEAHSVDMADNDYFSHYSQNGSSPADRVQNAGYTYPTVIGENIAAGYSTAASVFEGWRNSPDHNSTMLYPSFVAIGIGRHYNSSSYYGWYWTTDFGGYDDSGEPPPPPPPPPPAVSISSPTHPDQISWYAHNDPEFEWDHVPDHEGYSYLLDHSSATIPDSVIDSTDTGATYSEIEDGTWYFHVRARSAGGWGPPDHYRVRVDTTEPGGPVVISPTHPVEGTEYPIEELELEWASIDETSGIAGYSYLLDNSPGTAPDSSIDTDEESLTCPDLDEGDYYFHIKAQDRAGNWGSVTHFRVVIKYVPISDFYGEPLQGPEPLMVIFTDLSTSLPGIVGWLWDFGDGSTSDEANPTHVYLDEGNYTVSLTVAEEDGDSHTRVREEYVSVFEPAPDEGVLEDVLGELGLVIGSSHFAKCVDADARVDPVHPDMNFGLADQLTVDAQGCETYLRFDLRGLPSPVRVLAAKLVVYYTAEEEHQDVQVCIRRTDGEWSETEVTHATRPMLREPRVTTSIAMTSPSHHVFDISAIVSEVLDQESLSLGITWIGGTGALTFSSREGCCRAFLLIHHAPGDVHRIHFISREDTGTNPNFGEINVGGHPFSLPATVDVVTGAHEISYTAGHQFDRWDAQGDLLVANPLSASTILQAWGNGTVAAECLLASISYVYDDGEKDYSTGGRAGEESCVAIVPILAGTLDSIQIYFPVLYDYADNTAAVHVRDLDGEDLMPPTQFCPEEPGWHSITIGGQTRIVDEFLVCMEYLSDHYPRIGVDADGEGSSLVHTSSGWSEYHSNFMIRCVMAVERPLLTIVRATLELDPVIRAGSSVKVQGQLSPAMVTHPIELTATAPGGTSFNIELSSNSSGGFSHSLPITSAGEWRVLLTPDSVPGFIGAARAATFEAGKGEIELSCSVEPSVGIYGEVVEILIEMLPVQLPVAIEAKFNGGAWFELARVSNFTDTLRSWHWTPGRVGEYQIRATWEGNEDFHEETSYVRTLRIMRALSEISIEVDRTTAYYGSNVSIWGGIQPPLQTQVGLEYWQDMSWQRLIAVQTDQDGLYNHTWTVNAVGAILVRASWDGNDEFAGAATDGRILRLERVPTRLSCTVDPTCAELNQTVRIRGEISPAIQVPVTVTVTQPTGEAQDIESGTNSSGHFLTSIDPDKVGEWGVVASWSGNHSHLGCDSKFVSLTVAVNEIRAVAVLLPTILILLTRRLNGKEPAKPLESLVGVPQARYARPKRCTPTCEAPTWEYA